MSAAWAGGAGANLTGKKPGAGRAGTNVVVVLAGWNWLRCADSTTQRRSMLAFRPLANAIAAVETPGALHAATTWVLNWSP